MLLSYFFFVQKYYAAQLHKLNDKNKMFSEHQISILEYCMKVNVTLWTREGLMTAENVINKCHSFKNIFKKSYQSHTFEQYYILLNITISILL